MALASTARGRGRHQRTLGLLRKASASSTRASIGRNASAKAAKSEGDGAEAARESYSWPGRKAGTEWVGRAYVTTPIYYVNDEPHIGHVYTSVLADAVARYLRLAGREVMFLTGTDEHGGKVEQSAAKEGRDPQELADENAERFREEGERLLVSNDDFIRTTQERHTSQVKEAMRRLRDSGHLYLGEFEGWYDEGQEEYYTEVRAKELGYASPVNGKALVKASEQNYYFRLSQFQAYLERLLEGNDFVVPHSRRNEVLERVRAGLQDVPVSRTNLSWGVTMPFDGNHVVYVWIDALLNYVTALGLLNHDGGFQGQSQSKFWPATVHVMAKEITWFHAAIWPALLKALGLPLPQRIYGHGFWVKDGRKMSKSLGNFVGSHLLACYADKYGVEPLRYYLLTQGPAGSSDANFSSDLVQETYKEHLVDCLGNSCSRTTAMTSKYLDGLAPADRGSSLPGPRLAEEAPLAASRALRAFEDVDVPRAAREALWIVSQVDLFINDSEPFRLAKDPGKCDELNSSLYRSLEALRIATALLEPLMPETCARLQLQLGSSREVLSLPLYHRTQWGWLQPSSPVSRAFPFPKIEEALDESSLLDERGAVSSSSSSSSLS